MHFTKGDQEGYLISVTWSKDVLYLVRLMLIGSALTSLDLDGRWLVIMMVTGDWEWMTRTITAAAGIGTILLSEKAVGVSGLMEILNLLSILSKRNTGCTSGIKGHTVGMTN